MSTRSEQDRTVPAQRDSGGLWARQGNAGVPRATSRQRRTVQQLPAWEPLPPGEILVRRPTS